MNIRRAGDDAPAAGDHLAGGGPDGGPDDDDRAGVDLAGYLRARGTAPALVDRAEAEGVHAVRRLAQAVILLGDPPTMRPPEVWAATGASEETARALWRAMGFADLPDDAEALTPADVDALRAISDYLDATGVTPETAIRFTRLLGQTMGRVADALLSIMDQGLAEMEGLPAGEPEDLMAMAGDVVNPVIERELVYLLRRHLYAGTMRRLAKGDETSERTTVGFADVVSFTRLSGQLPEEDLAELLETFEATTADRINERGGRVVKLIGDAVLFSVDDPEAAADIALALVEGFGGDQPDLRVGMAHGPVIARLGDLFGPTVNLASRLVGFARPGSVVVDGAFVGELGDAGGFRVRSIRPRELKGIGVTPLHVLRRERRSEDRLARARER